jgi:hypothetical protein
MGPGILPGEPDILSLSQQEVTALSILPFYSGAERREAYTFFLLKGVREEVIARFRPDA